MKNACQTAGTTIVERNEDIRPIVDAACYYGHHGGGAENVDKQFALLVTTDVHGDSARFASAVQYLNEVPSLDAGICLGDMAPANFTQSHQWYIDSVLSAKKPWYTVMGNHDGGNSEKRKISGTVPQQFEKWMQPTLSKIGDTSITKTYYAVKIAAYKIELIVLNNQEVPDDTDENGDFLVHRGMPCFSQAQMDWFTAELASVPEDYTLVVAMHDLPEDVTLEPCAWTQPGIGSPSSAGSCYPGMITDIMNAWIHGEAVSGTYKAEDRPMAAYLPAVSVDADFTERGAGVFAGYLCGHVHVDAVGHVTKYPEQKYYSFASTANDLWQNHGCDLARAKGTKAEDCISVVVVDTRKKQLKLIRVGANFTTSMTERRFYIGTYGD